MIKWCAWPVCLGHIRFVCVDYSQEGAPNNPSPLSGRSWVAFARKIPPPLDET